MKKLSVLTAIALSFGLSNAHAAGYQLNEFSTTGLGRSFAGVGVMGDDYSAMGYNPAGMTLVKRSGVQGGIAVTEIASKAKSQYGTDKMDYFVPLPSLLGQYNVNNKLFLGAGVYIPYGLSTKYKHDSHVAQNAPTGVRKSYLEVIDFNFSTAYRFDNGLSIGGSAILRWIEGQLTSNINARNPDTGKLQQIGYNDYRVNGWTNAWQLGAMYEFDEDTRLGLSYRFKSTQKPRGKQYVYTNDDVFSQMAMASQGIFGSFNRYNTMANPELPASWILSGFHKWNEKWGTSATVKYIQWHRFYTFPAKSTSPLGRGNYDVDYRWKDSWTISLGQEYYMNDKWTLRAGTAWDQSPSANNYYRSNRIPDTDRIWLSAGASYAVGNHQVDLGYAHLFMMHGRTRNDMPGDLNVKYENHSNMFAVQYQYKF
ncbi:MAG: transporter [Alphaproteobacteria bacterium]|nr:transporter [Alphaproteobacteria bacterium]